MSPTPWWKGARGEWYVAIQLALFALVIFGPRNLAAWPEWPAPYARVASVSGILLLPLGALLIASGIIRLGAHATPLPYPKGGAPLRQTGPYRLVRHPIYSGGVFMALGWALFIHGRLTIVYALLLFVFLDLKARREERWLMERYPEYAEYRTRVRKLVPFLY